MTRAVILALLVAASTAFAEGPPPKADRDALAAAVEGVERDPPTPSWAGYAGVLTAEAVRRMWDGLAPMRGLFAPRSIETLAWAFLALVLVAAGIVLAREHLRRRDGVPAPPAAGGTLASPSVEAKDWLATLERRLAAGDVTGALEALWWVFARRVTLREVSASWTSSELVARARRLDLWPLAQQLDRFRYGPRRPTPADVRELATELAERTSPAEARG